MHSLIKCVIVITTFLFQTVVAEENIDIPIYHVDANNLKEVVGYADMAADLECFPFDPSMTHPLDVSTLTAATLTKLLTACTRGDKIELCTPTAEEEPIAKRGNQNILIAGNCNRCKFVSWNISPKFSLFGK